MASSAELASDSWHDALKFRKLLMRNLQKLHDATAVEASHFEAIDTCLDRYRLSCVKTIFHDFDYAVSQNAEDALWAVHVAIKTEYGLILARFQQHPSHHVERRKMGKIYSNFLSVAHYFYKTYIQRLNARYGIDELKRAAAGIQVEPSSTTTDTISVVTEDLRAKVLTSCHHTLIRLGDLSRYRIQGNPSNYSSSVAAALTYYGLAHHLEPQSGYALHQMGIVHLNQGNHLDIVYHFYRAWTVDKPNPLAKPNLERKFKALLSGQPVRRAPPSDREAKALEALTMWFVQLHAHFYKGQAFGPKQEELEKEVIHRLETIPRNVTSNFTMLKMALVNMAAHYVSAQRYNENQTDLASSLFYQYAICFNVRFVLILCGHIRAELEDNDESRISDDKDSTVGHDSFLPVLRIYCLWLAAHRSEVFGAADALGVLIPNMTQALARVFTLLCVETYRQENIQTAPYLTYEDIEIRGFLPLTEDRLPEACRVFCDETGNSKPYPPINPFCLTASKMYAARILDILRCAYFFTEDEAVPLTYRIEENSLIFEYTPRGKATSSPAASTASAEEASPPVQSEAQNTSKEAQVTPSDAVSEPCDAHLEAGSETTLINQAAQESSRTSNYEPSSEIDDADSTVLNMLTPFLKPPEPQPQHHPRSPAESSYNVHASTANGTLQSVDIGPTPTKSISSGKFEPLPWGWFNTPNPNQAQDVALFAGKDAFHKHHGAVSSPRMSMSVTRLPEDPFATPGPPYFNTFGRGMVDESVALCSDNTAGDDAHREQLLQSFGASGLPRTSAFSQWSQTLDQSRHSMPAPAGWDPRAFDGFPISSGTSAFSPSSSLYHGTLMNGARHDGPALGHAVKSGSQELSGRESGQLSGRQFQVDRTTSNYDEAILKAAYLGRR